MGKKYNEFYYSVDNKIHLDRDFWDMYNNTKTEAMRKYNKKMFCPFCRKAPLTVVMGNERKYFRVSESDMSKHISGCPTFLDEASKAEVKEFYDTIDDDDIQNRLVTYINRLLKNDIAIFDKFNEKLNNNNKKDDFSAFCFENKQKIKKSIPSMSLYSDCLRRNIDMIKLFYGKCKIYCKSYTDENTKEVKVYYLQILNNVTNKSICSLKISPKVYDYININFPESKSEAKMFYIGFFSQLYINKKGYLTVDIKHSKMVRFEEAK